DHRRGRRVDRAAGPRGLRGDPHAGIPPGRLTTANPRTAGPAPTLSGAGPWLVVARSWTTPCARHARTACAGTVPQRVTRRSAICTVRDTPGWWGRRRGWPVARCATRRDGGPDGG